MLMDLLVAEMIWPLFFTAALLVAMFVAITAEHGIFATVVLAIYLATMYWTVGIDLTWVQAHPLKTLMCSVGYLAAGALWTIWWWYRYCLRRLRKYEDAKSQFLRDHKLPTTYEFIPDSDNQKAWKEQWRQVAGYGEASHIPALAANHKATLCTVLAYWPLSVLESLLTRFLRGVFEQLYHWLASTLQRISDRIFAAAGKDLE